MKFGIIREGKVPPDSRVPLTPEQCAELIRAQDLNIKVQPAAGRCFPDTAYAGLDVPLEEDLSDRDILLGVKEVPIDQLIPDKTYLFFSHTIKKQPYNQKLLRAVVDRNIRLIDYEVLTDTQGRRLIAFGKFAGMVGAHNGMLTYGRRTGTFHLGRMKDAVDYAVVKEEMYQGLVLPPMKIVLTGTGRVGNGAAQVLLDMGIRRVSPADFLARDYDEAVFTQLDVADYARRKDGQAFTLAEFFADPRPFESAFVPFARTADLMINGIYWDNAAPPFFTLEEMRAPDWKIRVIADVTCDIAPVASIPSTLRATTIADPVFGFDPEKETETAPYQDHTIDMMTVDNLPNELPRDASRAFGEQFIQHILPEFFRGQSDILRRATIAENGDLGPHFEYLRDYLESK